MENKQPTKEELNKYAGYYSDSKLWGKLKKFAGRLGKQTIWYILLLYYTLQSPDVTLGNKGIILGALGYLILPIDLVPDFILGLGLVDDIAAIKLAYETVKVSITPEIEQKASEKLSAWFDTDGEYEEIH